MASALELVSADDSASGDDDEQGSVADAREWPVLDLPENIFSLVIMSAVMDTRDIITKSKDRAPRFARLFVSNFLSFANLFLQVYLLYVIKKFITMPAVNKIQDDYNLYEETVYGEVWKSGKHVRGVLETFNQTKFDNLGEDLKATICSIPLSNPQFLGAIIIIWTLTCLGELRSNWDLFNAMILRVPSIRSMGESSRIDKENEQVVIEGLTLPFKIYVTLFVFLPRLLVTLFLLWLGCRWLTATPCFSDIILNGIALEFILLIKELLYNTVVSERSRQDVNSCKVEIKQNLKVTMMTFISGILYLGLACFWVWFYLYHFQMVLPHYNWDVKTHCSAWIDAKYKFVLFV